jgi:hypothetical protein
MKAQTAPRRSILTQPSLSRARVSCEGTNRLGVGASLADPFVILSGIVTTLPRGKEGGESRRQARRRQDILVAPTAQRVVREAG